MPYLLDGDQLRVVRKHVLLRENRSAFAKTRFIVLEHVLPTTERFIHHLTSVRAEVFQFIAKPYSIDQATWDRMAAAGVPMTKHSYEELETTDVLAQLLASAATRSQADGKDIVILDVGGYFAKPLRDLPPEYAQFIAGVVEDTTFGHNRYLAQAPDIPVPIFSVARSPLKEIEARFVGRDAVAAMEYIFRQLGVSIAGRRALVIGYGMIGSSVSRALRSQDLEVMVYDKNDATNLRAFIDGFRIHKKLKLLEAADLIFAATADRALTWEDIEQCRTNVVLASVGSKDTEFDIRTLKEQAEESQAIGPETVKYRISNGKSIVVARDGTAVNFLLPSIPVEVLDLVFAEILLCTTLLLQKQDMYPPGVVYESPETFRNTVAKDWLKFVNTT